LIAGVGHPNDLVGAHLDLEPMRADRHDEAVGHLRGPFGSRRARYPQYQRQQHPTQTPATHQAISSGRRFFHTCPARFGHFSLSPSHFPLSLFHFSTSSTCSVSPLTLSAPSSTILPLPCELDFLRSSSSPPCQRAGGFPGPAPLPSPRR